MAVLRLRMVTTTQITFLYGKFMNEQEKQIEQLRRIQARMEVDKFYVIIDYAEEFSKNFPLREKPILQLVAIGGSGRGD